VTTQRKPPAPPGAREDGQAFIDELMTWCLAADQQGCEMPKRVRYELYARLDAYTKHDVRTLDEAFGVERPKGYSRAAAAREAASSLRLYAIVCFLKSAGVTSESAAIDAVGEAMKIKKTRANEYFRLQLERQGGARPSFPASDPNELPDELIAIFDALEPGSRKKKKAGV